MCKATQVRKYLPAEHQDKLEHPIPTLHPEETSVGKLFTDMNFTDRKNWIMIDEKYRYRMKQLQENGFSGDVDMKGFDPKLFSPMNPDVVFEMPAR